MRRWSGWRRRWLSSSRVLALGIRHAAHGEPVVLVAVVRRVDARSIHVQVVRVLCATRGTRPVDAAGA